MQTLKDELRESILRAAKKEFLEHGFKKSSMRSIAAEVGITVGNIYRYFEDKETLFREVVSPAFYSVVSYIQSVKDLHPSITDITQLGSLCQAMCDKFLEIYVEHADVFLILIDGSEGTRFHTAKDEVIALMADNIRNLTLKLLEQKGIKIGDDYFAHILATGFIEGYIAILKHYSDLESLKYTITTYQLFYFKNIASRFQ